MSSHNHRSRESWRFIVLPIGLVILVSGGFVWLLSLLDILAASWASILGPCFTILGAVIALVQWLWPMPPTMPTQQVQTKGKLQVKVRPQLCGVTVYADRGFHIHPPHIGLAAIVSRHRNGNEEEFIAEFEMEAGNYTISINSQEPRADITVDPGSVKFIDWSSNQP